MVGFLCIRLSIKVRAVVALLLPPYGREKIDMTSEGSTIAREKA